MIKLDLGCGKNKPDRYIGVDIIENKGVDIVHDCEKGLPFEDNTFIEIRAWDFLEHISRKNVIHLMNEIWRVLKPGGKFVFKTPDAERGQGAFQDPTHKSFWVINSFKYYENTYYKDLYGIKASFRIDEIRSTKYTDKDDYWGEDYALFGTLTAFKEGMPEIKNVNLEESKSNSNLIYTTDDVCPSNLKYWKHWLEIKKKYPEMKILAFVIANNKNEEDVSKSDEFKKWFEENKSWVEIGVHGYDHMRPQEGWREDQEDYIKKSLDILQPYLSEKIIYRAPGFRTLAKTEGILKKLGFTGIAHQTKIKYFTEPITFGTPFNTHCCDDFVNPITKWQNFL